VTSFESAKRAGYDSGMCDLGVTESLRSGGDLEGALRVLDGLSGAV